MTTACTASPVFRNWCSTCSAAPPGTGGWKPINPKPKDTAEPYLADPNAIVPGVPDHAKRSNPIPIRSAQCALSLPVTLERVSTLT